MSPARTLFLTTVCNVVIACLWVVIAISRGGGITPIALAATWGLLSLANGVMWWRARKGTRP